jgi:hypothetical protein
LALYTFFTREGSGENQSEYPFKSLKLEDVETVELLVQPPNTMTEIIESTQIQELIEVLHRVIIYEKDESWRDYNGQYVQYTIIKKSTENITIGAYNPFLIIDGIGYKTEYQPCEDLNNLANSIIN